jgi:superfamily II DNA helicase RecQ
MAQMAGISGVGDAKLERYGQQFLDVVRDFSEGASPRA